MFCIEYREYETAIINDFRMFFNVSAEEVGKSVSYKEALAYLHALKWRTDSWYFVSKTGWKYPMSQEALIAADRYDLEVEINTDPKKKNSIVKYPRPYDVLKQGQEKIMGTRVSFERAKVLYKLTPQKKTEAEIIEINRQKILAKKKLLEEAKN